VNKTYKSLNFREKITCKKISRLFIIWGGEGETNILVWISINDLNFGL
jgi:hypothetical protein